MKVSTAIKTYLGSSKAKMYLDSASMFNAKIETEAFGRYFIESSQFEDSKGYKADREYALKFIGDNHIYKVMEFKSKHFADKFWANKEKTKEGALVLDRFNCPREWFDKRVDNHYRIEEKLYDNGYTAFYSFELLERSISYCEGSIVEYHTPEHNKSLGKMRDRFLSFYRENVE